VEQAANAGFEASHKEAGASLGFLESVDAAHKKRTSEFLVRGIVQTVTMPPRTKAETAWRPDLTQINDIKLGQYIGQIGLNRLKRRAEFLAVATRLVQLGGDVDHVQTAIRQKDGKVEANTGKSAANLLAC